MTTAWGVPALFKLGSEDFSQFLWGVVNQLPSDRSEADCRREFAELWSCIGDCTERTTIEGCEAELTAMDAACMEAPPTCF